MRKFLIFCTIFALFCGCDTLIHRTDGEMFKAALKVYEDYLFEYGIDSALFGPPTTKTLQEGGRSYKWIAKGSEVRPVGIEVIVTRNKFTKPEMILIGDEDGWKPLVGSKNRR